MSEARPAGPTADRNLLYGMLALQMNFVTRDALLKAMQAWVFAQDRPLGKLLEEQGALTSEQRQALDLVATEHLKAHGGDAQRSLAAVVQPPTVEDVLQSLVVSDPAANLFTQNGTPASTDPPTREAMRYRVVRSHARGGLGIVFVARDRELGREVALKEMEASCAGNEVSRRRFVREAEITGGLEHPGIVPVYGLGRYADGRPYYAMRLIRGETLQEAVRKLHAGFKGYTLRGLLARYLDVCNAVAYAHNRGVIHRDLKPANVMLGAYGETLVLDWGLAKVVGRPTDPDVSEEVPEETLQVGSDDGEHAATRVGSAMGTPAYMSPEQAAGRLEEQGPTTDVYGLGATLYALLTGRAPVGEESDAAEVLERVRLGDWLQPSLVKTGVPVPLPLDAVCRKALALDPADRYPTVLALAAEVEGWLAGEPVAAYREPLTVRLRRWGRRHKTMVAAVGVLIVTAAIGLTAGLVAVDREKERTRFLERQIGLALLVVEAGNQARAGLYDQATRSYREALAKLEQLTAERPTPENQNFLASTLRDLGSLLFEHRDYAEAREVFRQAVDRSWEVVRAAPNIPRYRETLFDNVIRASEVLAAMGDHIAATDMALTAVGVGADSSDDDYRAARIFAICIPVAAKDAKLPPDVRADRARFCTTRSMEKLQQAVDKGFRNGEWLKNKAFASLSDRPDFQKLVTKLEEKPKEKPKTEEKPK